MHKKKNFEMAQSFLDQLPLEKGTKQKKKRQMEINL